MHAAEVLRDLGGVSTRAGLLRHVPRAEVDRALAGGQVVVVARGRYALPQVDAAVRLAQGHGGVLCLASAALHHGWEVKTVPERPQVVVPRSRRKPRTGAVSVHYRDLAPEDSDGIATSVRVTLDQSLRALPFDEALAIADSALRHGVPGSLLAGLAATAKGPGSARLRRVVRHASGEAANPFESTLRAIGIEVPGLHLTPQVLLQARGEWFRPDLVDRDLGIVAEADSFAWHGSRSALRRDADRYNALVVAGWLVLRFAWETVMREPRHVAAILEAAVARRAQEA